MVRFSNDDENPDEECPDVGDREVTRSQKSGACLVTANGEFFIPLDNQKAIINQAGNSVLDLDNAKIDASRIISIHSYDNGLLVFLSPGRKSFFVCEVLRVDFREAKVQRFQCRYYEQAAELPRPPTGIRVTDVSPDGKWFCGYIHLKEWELKGWVNENFMIYNLETAESKKVHRSHGAGKFYPI
ncbi:MAG: hypothetical protein ABI579_07415 [Candidatus Sumerlaeota bacterium]